jgi:DNA-binding PadR family transcriptional regulator
MNTRRTARGDGSKLAVLGLLSMGPNHGYGIRAILEGWEVHRWLDVNYGSIYAALNRFAESGLVEVVGVDADRGPTRTTYQLTPKGRLELEEYARRTWADEPKWSLPIDLAVMFLSFDWVGRGALNRKEVAGLLDERVATLEAGLQHLSGSAEETIGLTDLAPLRALQRAHFDHGLRLLETELEWTRSVRDALLRGDFDLPTDG